MVYVGVMGACVCDVFGLVCGVCLCLWLGEWMCVWCVCVGWVCVRVCLLWCVYDLCVCVVWLLCLCVCDLLCVVEG